MLADPSMSGRHGAAAGATQAEVREHLAGVLQQAEARRRWEEGAAKSAVAKEELLTRVAAAVREAQARAPQPSAQDSLEARLQLAVAEAAGRRAAAANAANFTFEPANGSAEAGNTSRIVDRAADMVSAKQAYNAFGLKDPCAEADDAESSAPWLPSAGMTARGRPWGMTEEMNPSCASGEWDWHGWAAQEQLASAEETWCAQAQEMLNWHTAGRELADDQSSQDQLCSNCGSAIAKGSTFCRRCGTKVDDEDTKLLRDAAEESRAEWPAQPTASLWGCSQQPRLTPALLQTGEPTASTAASHDAGSDSGSDLLAECWRLSPQGASPAR